MNIERIGLLGLGEVGAIRHQRFIVLGLPANRDGERIEVTFEC